MLSQDRGFSEQQYAREAYRQSAKDATIIDAAAIAAVAMVALLARAKQPMVGSQVRMDPKRTVPDP